MSFLTNNMNFYCCQILILSDFIGRELEYFDFITLVYWFLFADEFASKFSEWGKGYSELRCQLTSHQHAILIDLGRTFPNHG